MEDLYNDLITLSPTLKDHELELLQNNFFLTILGSEKLKAKKSANLMSGEGQVSGSR